MFYKQLGSPYLALWVQAALPIGANHWATSRAFLGWAAEWERGDVHIHAQMSQGVGLIGKVQVAFVHESRSNHRLRLLHNLPI